MSENETQVDREQEKYTIAAALQDEGETHGFRTEDLGVLKVVGKTEMLTERAGLFADLNALGDRHWGKMTTEDARECGGQSTLRIVIFRGDGSKHHAIEVEYPRTRNTFPALREAMKTIFRKRGYTEC